LIDCRCCISACVGLCKGLSKRLKVNYQKDTSNRGEETFLISEGLSPSINPDNGR
jgi:hypothetical protein